MTQIAQTLNNYSLRPILNFFKRLGEVWTEAMALSSLAKVQAELRKYKSYRDTYDELAKLSDNELKDIGISRGDIHSIALEAYADNLLGKKG